MVKYLYGINEQTFTDQFVLYVHAMEETRQ